MLTLPTPNATRATATPASSLVVRLELPESDRRASPGGLAGAQPDLRRLARAVEDLVRAVAPEVVTQISVEEPVSRPRLHAAPSDHLDLSNPPLPADRTDPARPLNPLAPGDPVALDRDSRRLTVDGAPVELTRREFDLLAYLAQRRTVALSRRELMNAVWRTGYLAGDRTIDVHVRRLRVKLGRHADRLTTLRGFGYRFD
jgi:DNA-binding response OmpR family regulator